MFGGYSLENGVANPSVVPRVLSTIKSAPRVMIVWRASMNKDVFDEFWGTVVGAVGVT